MRSINELNWDELNHSYQPSNLSFQTTEEIESIETLLGQDEAIKAIRQGLQIESKGYNLYICGVQNEEMEDVIIQEVEKAARQKVKPKAVGYLHNFSMPEEPIVIELETNRALELKQDLEELRAFILTDIPLLLESEESKEKQEKFVDEFQKLKNKLYGKFTEKAEQFNIEIKQTGEGIRFSPFDEKGHPYTKEAFLELSKAVQEKILGHIGQLQEEADQLMLLLERKEKQYAQLYAEVGEEIVLREVGKNIKRLQEKYGSNPLLQRYFNGVAEEILSNLVLFAINIEEGEMKGLSIKKEREQIVNNYGVNWLSLPKGNGAPVVRDIDESHPDIMANILLAIDNNMMQGHFLNIYPGLINKANGGYLILHMDELIKKNNSWQQLKNVLKTDKMIISGNEGMGIALVNSIRPRPFPIRLKVILIGNESAYEVLKTYDEDFAKLFKMKVNFNEELNMKQHSILQVAGKIKMLSEKENIKPVTKEGLKRILEYGYRKMEHPYKISSDLEWIMDILREAQSEEKTQIDKEDIETCLWRRSYMERQVKEEMDESLLDGTYLMDTNGKRIGQINGLAVYGIGEAQFGRPIRITATTYRGKQGIIDIENEARLSGAIHTKGIQIITGFLGSQFAQEWPLSLNCQICFEQSYAGVDGDSASSAELYAVLSSLSELPICQNIAVTGSVNQFGEIQPVGGINEKIEGFYQVCKQRGLIGSEAVMIPRKNVKELLLGEEIIEAVKNKQFHIYAINDIWEGVEILLEENRECVKKRVVEKLNRFAH